MGEEELKGSARPPHDLEEQLCQIDWRSPPIRIRLHGAYLEHQPCRCARNPVVISSVAMLYIHPTSLPHPVPTSHAHDMTPSNSEMTSSLSGHNLIGISFASEPIIECKKDDEFPKMLAFIIIPSALRRGESTP